MDLVIAAVAAAAVLAAVGYAVTRRGVARYEKRRVVVHTKEGTSLQGVLVGSYADCFALREAKYLSENADLGGEAVVLKANVDWVQAL